MYLNETGTWDRAQEFRVKRPNGSLLSLYSKRGICSPQCRWKCKWKQSVLFFWVFFSSLSLAASQRQNKLFSIFLATKDAKTDGLRERRTDGWRRRSISLMRCHWGKYQDDFSPISPGNKGLIDRPSVFTLPLDTESETVTHGPECGSGFKDRHSEYNNKIKRWHEGVDMRQKAEGKWVKIVTNQQQQQKDVESNIAWDAQSNLFDCLISTKTDFPISGHEILSCEVNFCLAYFLFKTFGPINVNIETFLLILILWREQMSREIEQLPTRKKTLSSSYKMATARQLSPLKKRK